MKLKLTVTDENAPSDKYPKWGFSVDFKDENGNKFYAEYPNYKSSPFDFVKGETYSFDCATKEEHSLFSKYTKVSRIKNIQKI